MKKTIKKTYQVECGNIQGFLESKNEGLAFRTLMRLDKWTKNDWGVLARFREVVLNNHFEIIKRGKWAYIEPESLYNL